MPDPYLTLDALVCLIDDPPRTACQKLLADHRARFEEAYGSTHNHQSWPGGYLDHVQEVMNVVVVLQRTLGELRPLPFSLSDALLVCFFHDVEKPWKYEMGEDGKLRHKKSMETKAEHQAFREAKLEEYGVVFTPEQENGMKYAEGEIGVYTNERRVMGPLAALAHMCDVARARLWFDHPMGTDEARGY